MLHCRLDYRGYTHLISKYLSLKALLILDNATCHGTNVSILDTDNFKLLYLPPNTTAYLQPNDQRAIKSLKTRYRKCLLTTLASRNENISDSLKNVILKGVDLWNNVPKSAIVNAFKYLYSSAEDIELNLLIDHFKEDDKNKDNLNEKMNNGLI